MISGRVLESFDMLWAVLLHEYFLADHFSVGFCVCLSNSIALLYLLHESHIVLSKGIDDGGKFMVGLLLYDGLMCEGYAWYLIAI
jgi:hypothetical protein